MSETDQPTPQVTPEPAGQLGPPTTGAPAPPAAGPSVPPSGKRQAFRDIRRQLTDTDLTSPGVQMLILDELERAESQCELLQVFVDRYHDADKRAAVLEERGRTARSVELLFGVGVGVGCAIIGLAPFFWNNRAQGVLTLIVGAVLVAGAVIARSVKR